MSHKPSLLLFVNAAVVAAFVLIAVFANWLAPFSVERLMGRVWQDPDLVNLLGTDNLGRDLLSRLIVGTQLTLGITFLAVACSFAIGVPTALFACVASPWVDTVLSRLVDALISIPSLIVALIALSVLGSSIPTLILVIGVIDSLRVFRFTRSVAMDVTARDFVEVARLRGERPVWIMLRELLPNISSILVVEFALRFSFAMLVVSALSFLGLGVQPPSADWGALVRENAVALNIGVLAPLYPAMAIAIFSVCLNHLADEFLYYWDAERRYSALA